MTEEKDYIKRGQKYYRKREQKVVKQYKQGIDHTKREPMIYTPKIYTSRPRLFDQ